MRSEVEWEASLWPIARLSEALAFIHVDRDGSRPRADAQDARFLMDDPEKVDLWIDSLADACGIEAVPTDLLYGEVNRLLSESGPVLLRLPAAPEPKFLLMLRPARRGLCLLRLDLTFQTVRPELLHTALCQEAEMTSASELEPLLDTLQLSGCRRAQARCALLGEQLRLKSVARYWRLRLLPNASLWREIQEANLCGRLAGLLAAHTIEYVLWLLAWWVLGQAVLQGRFDSGWLTGWALLLFFLVPIRLLVTWSQGRLAIRAGALLKQRLLQGLLQLDSEEMREQGIGQLVGRVTESQAFEALTLSGAFLALVAFIELAIAGGVLAAGVGSWMHSLALLVWVLLMGLAAWRYFKRCDTWTETRLRMNSDLVERMIGHRTCVSQEQAQFWHDGEDAAMALYITQSSALDRAAALLMALGPRGWLMIGLVAIAPAFPFTSQSPGALAISLGGVLLAYRALEKASQGVSHLVHAAIAWKQIAPLLRAAAPSVSDRRQAFPEVLKSLDAPMKRGDTVLEAHHLVYRYADRAEAVLQRCHLRIGHGDRLLLEGSSGCGKSTLAALLAGLRWPNSGAILLRGIDRQTMGTARWRQLVTIAPQYHENHVLTGTLAFNLLMGRNWPPSEDHLKRAEALCIRLGLGDLLQRMPAGLMEMVGESGWQLSQGEKSRLYIARALLKDAKLVVLDESLASLDPENLRLALDCVLEDTAALLVVAQP
jgi:ATP-binding cassette subfamily B protein